MPRPQRRPERLATPSDVLPTNNLRPEVRIEQLGEGCIVWLPAKDENEPGTITSIRNSCCSNRELTKGGYNHPVLLLKIKQDGICSFAQASIFDRLQKSMELMNHRLLQNSKKAETEETEKSIACQYTILQPIRKRLSLRHYTSRREE